MKRPKKSKVEAREGRNDFEEGCWGKITCAKKRWVMKVHPSFDYEDLWPGRRSQKLKKNEGGGSG